MEVLENFKNLFFDVWNKGISGVNISEIVIALLIFLFFLFLRGIFSKFVIKRLENYVSKTTNNFDNSLVFSMEGPAKFFPIVLGFFVSTSYLTIESQAAEFIETLNNWYIRRSRNRFWDKTTNKNARDAYDTLYTVLNTLLKFSAPLIPLISEKLYMNLNKGNSVHLEDWPDVSNLVEDKDLISNMDIIRKIVSHIDSNQLIGYNIIFRI